ncbi:putative SIT1-Transporter of the bacterial siderophore ferrioxamine B [Ophiocordyceps camponoti-floridani]|uniref:Putative SIT1-Transporter of the bacterial siderophore ferrioxamine B n=1 Tax=Ophiocordyceps camponoti-floridani TaxID=2030778 RepID=A0A8H4Q315_9HYPO|nr:putative SIT1-Transporter of the bacterial siderophore ferrioxamine B [Ophiocordyceps camponoti-floridani]
MEPSARSSFFQKKSPGVRRVEALVAVMTWKDRVRIMVSILVIATVIHINNVIRGAIITRKTNMMQVHGMQAPILIARSIAAASTLPPAARLADVMGRRALVWLSLATFIGGTLLETFSMRLTLYVVGNGLSQMGFTVMGLFIELLIANISSTRSRIAYSLVPALPVILATFVSGLLVEVVLADGFPLGWTIGMWCFIFPLCTMPLMLSLMLVARRRNEGSYCSGTTTSCSSSSPSPSLISTSTPASPRLHRFIRFCREIFWVLDIVGVALIATIMFLLFFPPQFAGGLVSRWSEPAIYVPMMVGAALIPFFIFWEYQTRHPLIPLPLMRHRSVWAPLAIAFFANCAHSLQANHIYVFVHYVLGRPNRESTVISSLDATTSAAVGMVVGIVIMHVRRLKVFVISGTLLYFFAHLLVFYSRYWATRDVEPAVIGAQILLGAAAGFFPYPTLTSLQAGVDQDHLAIVTSFFSALYQVGNALGHAVAGIIWTQLVPFKLVDMLGYQHGTQALLDPAAMTPNEESTGSGLAWAARRAYRSVFLYNYISGVVLAAPVVIFGLLISDPKLNHHQSLVETLPHECDEAVKT